MQGFVFAWLIALAGISGPAAAGTASGEPAAKRPSPAARQFTLTTQSKYPTVGFKDYVLVTDDLERDRAKAEAVVQAKIELPRAMQTKAAGGFRARAGAELHLPCPRRVLRPRRIHRGPGGRSLQGQAGRLQERRRPVRS